MRYALTNPRNGTYLAGRRHHDSLESAISDALEFAKTEWSRVPSVRIWDVMGQRAVVEVNTNTTEVTVL